MAQQIKKKYLGADSVDGSKIKLLFGQALRVVDNSGASVELLKIDADGKVMAKGSELGFKSDVSAGVAEAKAYADNIKSEIMGGLPATALDTIKELADAVANDESGIASLVSSVGSLNSGLSQEISDRQSAVSGEATARQQADSNLQGQVDSLSASISALSGTSSSALTDLTSSISNEVSARIAGDADTLAQAGAYGDMKRAQMQAMVEATYETKASHLADKTEMQNTFLAEKALREGAESVLSSRIGALEADPVTKTYVDGKEAGLQSQINNILQNSDPQAIDSLSEILSAFQSADGNLQASINALSTSATSAIAGEASRAQGEEARIEAKVDTEISNRISNDAQVLADAKSYADSKSTWVQNYTDTQVSAVSAVIVKKDGSVPFTASQSMGGFNLTNLAVPTQSHHATGKGYVDGAISTASASLTTAVTNEATARASADSALSARVSTLEAKADGPNFHKMKVTIGAVTSYVDLAHTAVNNSIVVGVGRLMAHVTEDYTISVVNGVTRLTFVNSMASGGSEAIETGDNIFLTYAYAI